MGSAPILAIIVGLSVSCLYYVQSLLPQIGRDLALSAGEVLLIPMTIQIGLALSLLFLLPIGDGVDRHWVIGKLSPAAACLLWTWFRGFSALSSSRLCVWSRS